MLLVASCFNVASADDGEKKNGLFSYKLKGNGNAVITHFDWKSNGGNDVYVPRQIDGYNVSEIGNYAFSSETLDFSPGSIGQEVVIVLPDTITVIGEKAFYCSSISAITIPKSVQLIGSGAFAGCCNLASHNVESGNSVYATIDGVLYNKSKKELVSYPMGGNSNGVSKIPDGIVSVGEYAFAGCECYVSDKQNNLFPESLTSIGNYAFYKSKIIARNGKINFNNTRVIGDYAFYSATFAQENSKNWPATITGDYVQELGAYSFYDVSITFKNRGKGNESAPFPLKNVKKIGDYAFASSYFSSSDDGIGLAFPRSLQEIGIGSFMALSISQRHFSYCTVKMDFTNTKISIIPEYAFSEVKTDIVLPETINEIKDYAFYKLRSENGVLVRGTVDKIGQYAFAEGSGGKVSNVKDIGDYAYYNAESCPSTLPEGLERIGEKALWSDTRDLEISIPASVIEIGESFCNRGKTTLLIVPGTYGALYASENGYRVQSEDDTSWLND